MHEINPILHHLHHLEKRQVLQVVQPGSESTANCTTILSPHLWGGLVVQVVHARQSSVAAFSAPRNLHHLAGRRHSMMKTPPFALRCGADWVIWNRHDWNDAGWIDLALVSVGGTRGGREHRFRLGWNGERLAGGSELQRLTKFDRSAAATLTGFLESRLPKPQGVPR